MKTYSKLSDQYYLSLHCQLVFYLYVQRANVFSIDFSSLPGFRDNQGINFLQDFKCENVTPVLKL